ncbi:MULTISPECIES: Rv3654c family TadE-like protein [unclassified Pseudonocardia]|uniref:Rv3654c family TadE-like protein n=1 Tax=unclassified Pseudonocardia TaxID=2619320 RepID=UPI00094B54A6|nr:MULTISPECIES: Rv3654c family TadE-like protein [unclassified Pseudonocardia]
MTADSSGPRTRSRSGAAPRSAGSRSAAPSSTDPLGTDPHDADPHSAHPLSTADRIRHDDTGVASVWAAIAAAVLLLVGAVGVDVAAAVRARHVAAAAADLSALAAAGRSVEGTEIACRVAADLAARNGAEVAACHLDGWDALVEARVRWSGLLPIGGPATARARAGPAPLDDGTGAVTPARRRGESDHALGERSAALGERTDNSAARPHHVR